MAFGYPIQSGKLVSFRSEIEAFSVREKDNRIECYDGYGDESAVVPRVYLTVGLLEVLKVVSHAKFNF